MKSILIISIAYSLILNAASAADAPRKRHVRQLAPTPPPAKGLLPKPPAVPSTTGGLHPMLPRTPVAPSGDATAGTGATASGSTATGVGTPTTGEVTAPPADGCEQKHPLEAYVQISADASPQAAADGGVFFLSDRREVSQLYYLAAPGAEAEQLTFFPDGAAYFRVSPDGKKILVATHVGGDEQYMIHLADPVKRTVVPLLVDRTYRVDSVAWGPKSDWFAYTSNERNKTDMDVHRFVLAEGKGKPLVQLTGHNTVTDVSPDGKLVAGETYRSISDGDLWVTRVADGVATYLTKAAGAASFQSPHFSADSAGLYYLTDFATGRQRLFYRTLDGAKPPRVLTAESGEVEDLALDRARGSLAYLVNDEGYSRLKGFLVDRAGRKKGVLPTPKLTNAVARSVSFTPDGKAFFHVQTDSRRSPEIWQWKSPTSKPWSRVTSKLRAECFTDAELVHYPTFDGRSIPAFLFRPSAPPGPIPFIVWLHGGPAAQYRPAFSRISQYLLERGYGIFAPNFRGSTGYGREYHQLDDYKQRMNAVKDVIEGAKWLLAKGYASPGGLAVTGGSYGGFLVLRSLQEAPDLFSAASESVGISDFVSFLKNTKPYRRALREVEYGPLSDEAFLKSISPMSYLEKMKTPLIIFHGANDPRVPVGETEQIAKALRERGVIVETKIFPDEGHGNAKQKNILEQTRAMAYFFEKYLTAKK